MRQALLQVAAALCALGGAARADMVAVAWDAAGRFDQTVPLRAGKFVEACERLPRGARVRWSFEAGVPLDFNIHYHEGKNVLFPVRQAQVAQAAGTLAVELDQDYCWMWTHQGAGDTTLRFRLDKG